MSRTDGTLADRERWHDEQLKRDGAQRRDHLIATGRMVTEHEWRASGGTRPMRYTAVWQMEQYELPHTRHTLRVDIKRDAYLGQSYITVERLGVEWHEVHRIPAELLPENLDLNPSKHGRDLRMRNLDAEEVHLMRGIAGEALIQACQIIGLLEIVNCEVWFNAERGRIVSVNPDDND